MILVKIKWMFVKIINILVVNVIFWINEKIIKFWLLLIDLCI